MFCPCWDFFVNCDSGVHWHQTEVWRRPCSNHCWSQKKNYKSKCLLDLIFDADRHFHARVSFCSLLKSNKCFDCVLISTGDNFYNIFAGSYRHRRISWDVKVCCWLIFKSLCTISDIIFCVAINLCYRFLSPFWHLSHSNALVSERKVKNFFLNF